jgi:hypothetical protein
MQYYILRDSEQEGPYDLIAIIRKIKNGSLSRSSILLDGDKKVVAENIPQLEEVFNEHEKAFALSDEKGYVPAGYFTALKKGWELVRFHLSFAVVTGIHALIALTVVYLLSGIFENLLLGLLSALWCYFIFIIYTLSILRKSRMQLLNIRYYKNLMAKYGGQLVILAQIFVVITAFLPIIFTPILGPLAYFLFLVPGSLLLTYIFFVPMVMCDRGVSIKEAFVINHERMKYGGLDNFTLCYTLLMTNIIAAPTIVGPFIILPVTFAALSEVYDSLYNEY